MIVFDEKKYAEEMIKKGFKTKHKNVYELYILSKYYYSKDKDINLVKESIVKFCEKYIEYFNIDEWYKIINNTVKLAEKNNLITGKEVSVTKKELEIICELEKLNEQKVAFVMLVLYKFYDYKKFEVMIEDLYRLCKLNINSQTKLKILQTLTSKELIDITMGGKRSVKFADKIGDSEIVIKDFDDFIYEYERHIGEDKIGICECCGKAIKVTSNRKKYCKECWKEVRNEYQKELMRKRRSM